MFNDVGNEIKVDHVSYSTVSDVANTYEYSEFVPPSDME